MYLIIPDGIFLFTCRLLGNLNIIAVGVIKLQMPHHRQDQVSCVHISPDWPLSLTLRVQYHYHIKRRESLTITSQCFVRKFRYERNANAL